MKRHLYLIGLFVMAVSFSFGCTTAPQKKSTKLITPQLSTPAYYKQIPADTPYFFSDMAPLKYNNLSTNMYAMLEPVRVGILEPIAHHADRNSWNEYNRDERLVYFILNEFSGKMSPEGFESLGLDPRGSFALYGVGFWPVLRIPVSDEAKVNAAITRIETNVGQSAVFKVHKGTKVREIKLNRFHFTIAVENNALILGMTASGFKDTFLDYALGKVNVTKSMFDDNKLVALQKEYKYKSFMTGFVDFVALASGVFGRDPNNFIFQSVKMLPSFKSETTIPRGCKSDFPGLAKVFPKFVMGFKAFSSKSMTLHMGLENTNGLSEQVGLATTPVPLTDTDLYKASTLFGGLGVDVEALYKGLLPFANMVAERPYQCIDFSNFNTIPRLFKQFSNVPKPIQTVKGAAMHVGDFADMSKQTRLKGLKYAGVVRTPDPQGFFQYMKNQPLTSELKHIKPRTNGVPALDKLTTGPASGSDGFVILNANMAVLGLHALTAKQASVSLKQPVAKKGPLVVVKMNVQNVFNAINTFVFPQNTRNSSARFFSSIYGAYKSIQTAYGRLDATKKGFFVEIKGDFIVPKK